MDTHTSDDEGSSEHISKPEERELSQSKIPSPPPLPRLTIKKNYRIPEDCYVPEQTFNLWDNLLEKCQSRSRHCVHLISDDQKSVPTHKSVLSIASPVFRAILQEDVQTINIPLVPHGALRTFVRLLYSSRYDEKDMRKFVLYVLRLSHRYELPLLTELCIKYIDAKVNPWLNTRNVINAFQVARECDLPRLSSICFRLIVKDFEAVKLTNGWREMSDYNRALEVELSQAVKSRMEEMEQKTKDKDRYLKLHTENEALIHIYESKCPIIIDPETLRKGKYVMCDFPECEEIRVLLRHFDSCGTRVSGVECATCTILSNLMEVHSRMCNPDSCVVPLCSSFREKMSKQNGEDDIKWSLLAHHVKSLKLD